MAEAQFLDELTPEQQAAALEQLKTPSATPQAEPAGEDPLDVLTPEEYLNLWVETKNDYLKPDVWAARNPERVNDPGVQAKLADIYALSRERGFKFSDIDLWEATKGVGHAVLGIAKNVGQTARSAVEFPVTLAGQPEGPEKERLLMEQAQRATELGASTESAVTGLVDLGRAAVEKAGKWVGKLASKFKRPEEEKGPGSKGQPEPTFGGLFTPPMEETPEERQAKFRSFLARSQMHSDILKGHGAALGAPTGDFVNVLEKAGLPIDPERVAALAAGDPLTFVAIPGGFKIATVGGKAIANVATKAEAVQLLNQLRIAQRAAAAAAKVEGAAARNLASEQAAFKAGGPIAAPGLAEAPDALRAAQAATAEAKAGVTAAQAAVDSNLGARALQKAVPVVEAVQSGVEKAKDLVKAGAARGTDIALGTGIYGAGTAARAAGGITDFVSSFLPPMVTPRAVRTAANLGRGVGIGVQNTGKALMAANEASYSPRIRLISDMARSAPDIAAGAGKGFLMFDVPFAAATSESPTDTAHMPVFAATLGALGKLPRVGQRIVQSQLAKPFDNALESNAPIRDYTGMPALNEATRNSVANASDPRQVQRLAALRQITDAVGAQLHWASDKATFETLLRKYLPGMDDAYYKEAANQRGVALRLRGDDGQMHKVALMQDMGAAPHDVAHVWQQAMGEEGMKPIRDLVWNEYAPIWDERGWNYVAQFFGSEKLRDYINKGEGWQEAIIDLASGNADWRSKLTPEQVNDKANTYLNDEISGEIMDTVLKNRGPELVDRPGIIGSFARILGKTLMGLGVEPFEGVTSEGQRTPITMEGSERVADAFRTGMTDIQNEAARKNVEAAPAFGGARRSPVVVPRRGGSEPGTSPETSPEPTSPTPPAPAEAAAEARDIASTSPDAPISSGGQPQKQIISDIADSIENRGGVRINYLSAPGEPAGAISSNRTARRAVIEAFRSMPESARALFEKTFFPERVVRLRDGKLQVLGWAPEVFAANAFKLAETLSNAKRADLSPYPIDPKTKSFTEHGWRQLHEDLNTFGENQTAGLTGAGEPLVVPKSVTDQGFRAPDVTGSGKTLSQDRADFINALFGIPVPRTPRIGNVFPRNLAGQQVSAATKPGRVTPTVEPRAPFTGEKAQRMGIEGETLKNVNPFVAELEAAGIKPSFIEAMQRLNMDRILSVEGAPEVQNFRGNEFTLQAGFQPREGDLARYNTLREEIGKLSLEERFGQKGQTIAKEIEEIKNRNGGNPPDQAPGLGKMGETEDVTTSPDTIFQASEGSDVPVQFQPKTETGRKLEEKGYKFKWALPSDATEAKLVVYKGDREAGYLRVDKNPEDMPEVYPPGSFDIGMVKVHPDFRKQGLADGLYREALSVLRDSGVKNVTGFMIAETPLKTRERLMPGAQEYRSASALNSSKMTVEEALEQIQTRSGVEVRSKLTPDMQFQPKPDEPGAIKAAAVRSEDGTIYTGPMHLWAYMEATKAGRDFMSEKFDEGFVTNSGEFLNRNEASQRAFANGQTNKKNVFGLSSEDIKFQPGEDKPKAVKAAAVRIKSTGEIFEGPFHAMAYNEARNKRPELVFSDSEDGFVTNSGEFLTREEAYTRARAQRQLTAEDAEGAITIQKTGPRRLEAMGFNDRRQFQPKTDSGKELADQGFEFTFKKGRIEIQKDGEPAAFIEYEPLSELYEGAPSDRAEIINVRTYDKFRNKGLGTALYREALTDLRDRGVREIEGLIVSPEAGRIRRKLLPGTISTEADGGEFTVSTLDATSRFQPKPNEDVQKIAAAYKGEKGFDTRDFSPIAVKPATAKKIADFYENAKNDPENEAVQASYKALADETAEQYNMIVDSGYTLEPYKGRGEPYKSSDEMTADVRDNKHLYFLPTESALAKSESNNPMLADSGINGWPVNDLFRAVHDFFGHAAEGLTFGPKGELNAWKVHSEMYSPEAQGALAAETLAQNSWVNFGKHLRDEAGNIPEKGQPGYRPLTERPFAEQKNIVIPKELIDEARGTFQPKKKGGEKADEKPTGWILPNGKFESLQTNLHENEIAQNFERYNKEFGTKFTGKEGVEDRNKALQAGFVRIRVTPNGDTTYEMNQKFVGRQKAPTLAHALRNKGRMNNLSVNVLNDKGRFVGGGRENIYMAADSEAAIRDLFAGIKGADEAPTTKGTTAIQRAREFGQTRFQPRSEEDVFLRVRNASNSVLNNWDDIVGPLNGGQAEFIARNAAKWGVNRGDNFVKVTRVSPTPEDRVVSPENWISDFGPSVKGAFAQFAPRRQEARQESSLLQQYLSEEAFGHGGIDRTGVKTPLSTRELSEMTKPKDESQHLSWADLTPSYLEVARKAGYRTLDLSPAGSFHAPRIDPVLRKDEMGRWSLSPADITEAKNEAQTTELKYWELSRDAQFAPRKQEAALPGFEVKTPLSTRELSEMTKPELRAHFPEAVVPKEYDKIVPSNITESPLFKRAGSEEAAVEAFAKRLVDFAREYEGSEQFKRGSEWYSDFTPRLKKEFGADAEIMAELLAATSPNTNPEVNFGYAFDALKSFKDGRFEKILPKFEEGLKKIEDGSWEKWYAKEVKAGKVPDAPETPSPASFLAHWITKYDLKPKQSNGKLYGMHGVRVLQVIARRWMQMNAGPKTRNFVDNLLGRSDEATIDVWADRTMRWAGYEGHNPRWRILPENSTGVSDKDFAFSQKVFRRAAEQLGIKPSALQGALWFAEKQRWADNGWGRLDLGDFRTEMEKLPLLESGYNARVRKTEAEKRGKKTTQTELVVEPRFAPKKVDKSGSPEDIETVIAPIKTTDEYGYPTPNASRVISAFGALNPLTPRVVSVYDTPNAWGIVASDKSIPGSTPFRIFSAELVDKKTRERRAEGFTDGKEAVAALESWLEEANQ